MTRGWNVTSPTPAGVCRGDSYPGSSRGRSPPEPDRRGDGEAEVDGQNVPHSYIDVAGKGDEEDAQGETPAAANTLPARG